MSEETKATEAKTEESKSAVELLNELKGKISLVEVTTQNLINAVNYLNDQIESQIKPGLLQITKFYLALDKVIATGQALTSSNLLAVKDEMDSSKRKADIDRAVAQGAIQAVDTIDTESFVVFKETDKEGKVMASRTDALSVAALPDNFKLQVVGQKAGVVVQLSQDEGGHKFEVIEIYKVVKKDAQPEAAPASATSPEESQAAPAPAAEAPATDAPQS